VLRLGLGAAAATFAALAAVRLETEGVPRSGSTRSALPSTPVPDPTTPVADPTTASSTSTQARTMAGAGRGIRVATDAPTTSTTEPGRAATAASPTTTTTTTSPRTAATTEPAPPTTSADPTRGTTPGQQPAPPSALQFFGPTAGRAVYLTIDDGWFPDPRVLDLVRAEQLPITTFLIRDAAEDDPEHFAFWRAFVDAGGQVQNHTVSHPWLTGLSPGQIEAQWEGASVAFRRWFGARPTLGRPPYGAVDDAVWRAAANTGLTSLVMWSAVDSGQGLQTWDHAPLAPGDIVLLHWDPGLYGELRQVLAAVETASLTPRFLPA